MPQAEQFFSQSKTSLKVCGITQTSDAEKLVELGIEALGINFWEKSKRYCSPTQASEFIPFTKGKILRVGVFVNATEQEVLQCFHNDLIEVAQFHGDESNAFLKQFATHNLPFIKAIGVKNLNDLENLTQFHTPYLLLDAHAPGVYGGTGETIDWKIAADAVSKNSDFHLILAGGITPDNASEATKEVRPCALDVASGAELKPGIKDLDKVRALMDAIKV